MKQLLDSNLEFVVDSGFLYVPLLLDPAIAKEVQGIGKHEMSRKSSQTGGFKSAINVKGRYFVPMLSLHSFLENYEKFETDSFQQFKNAFLRKYLLTPEIESISIDSKLMTIMLRVMPYFIKKNRGLKRKRLTDEEMLDLIGKKIDIPRKYYEAAETYLDIDALQRMLRDLDDQDTNPEFPNNGRLSARDFKAWFHKALQTKIIKNEKEHLKQALKVRNQFRRTKKRHLSILLYITAKGSLKIDDFGLLRTGDNNDYLVYKHTGEYILKDYYARSYRFPDCRVAVSTAAPLRPIVMETYKHPFLLKHDSGQEICIGGFNPPKQFTVNDLIKVLEDGINTLLYGYDSRRRNGIHSLDHRRVHVRGIEFDDYRI